MSILEIRFINDSERAAYGFLMLYISSTKCNTEEWVLKELDGICQTNVKHLSDALDNVYTPCK